MSDAHAAVDAHAGHSAEDIKKHVRVYMIVFGALAVLTVVTVAVSYLDLPMGAALAVAVLIASIKAGLVAAYFMHLVSERKVIFATLIMTGAFLIFMFILFVAAEGDQAGAPEAAEILFRQIRVA